MNKLDKLVENKIKADGWIKLLPTEKCQTSQPHRFRYTDGKNDAVSIIQYGALAGVFANFDISHTDKATTVYQSAKWKEKYKEVDWDTPECNCTECSMTEGLEELTLLSKSAATIARKFEGLVLDETVDIAHLQIDQEDNGYKKVTFYYKIPDTEDNTKTS